MRSHSEEGQTMVEAAIVLPIFLMFLFGVFESGLALYTYHYVAFAAQFGTRYAIVHGATSGDPANATDIANYVKSRAPEGINRSKMTVTTSWSPNNQPGSSVTVSVSYDFQFDIPFLPNEGITMASNSEMVISQ